MMDHLVGDGIGLAHLAAALLSLVSGTCVLVLKKGTTTHKIVGRVYAASMLIVVATSFMIYRFFGGFGIFHVAAIVSFVTLLGGMVPPLLFRSNPKWIHTHLGMMYWSVMGLYAAFVAEVMVRIPEAPFYNMVGWATGGVMLVGGAAFGYYKKSWEATFG